MLQRLPTVRLRRRAMPAAMRRWLNATGEGKAKTCFASAQDEGAASRRAVQLLMRYVVDLITFVLSVKRRREEWRR
jgi:hypothetical protein